jgi:integrase
LLSILYAFIFPLLRGDSWVLYRILIINPGIVSGLAAVAIVVYSINHIRHTLNIVFQEAKRQGLVKENPVADIEPLPNNYTERGTFTLDELGKLFPPELEKLVGVWKSPLWAVMHYLMLTTGMRVGEAGALLWRHVVWEKRGMGRGTSDRIFCRDRGFLRPS